MIENDNFLINLGFNKKRQNDLENFKKSKNDFIMKKKIEL